MRLSATIVSSFAVVCVSACKFRSESKTLMIEGEFDRTHRYLYLNYTADPKNQSLPRNICTGTVLNDNTILAAGHCFWSVNEKRYLISTGQSLSVSFNLKLGASPLTVTAVEVHPSYLRQSSSTKYAEFSDIALLRVKEKLSQSLRAFKIPKDENLHQKLSFEMVRASTIVTKGGWGFVDTARTISEDWPKSTEAIVIDADSIEKTDFKQHTEEKASRYFCTPGAYFPEIAPTFSRTKLMKSIAPGDSGGPLFDRDGRVIGVNSHIVGREGVFQTLMNTFVGSREPSVLDCHTRLNHPEVFHWLQDTQKRFAKE